MEKKKILIVEDEIIIAENIKKHLQAKDYNVLGIITMGEDAIEALSLLKPDLVLLDIKLEGSMDGIQVAEIIRQEHQIPVIFLTSYGDDNTLSQAILS
ncbi:MAG: response regulator, partial [Candidatus Cloacimonetes bacterium]|nr:response regulator [Candidatus Cloacimonadota bacterium]